MKYQLLDPYVRYFLITDKYMCAQVDTYAEDYRLFMGLKNGCVLVCNNEEYPLNENCIAIIPPKTFYRLKRVVHSEILIMNFDMDSSRTYIDALSPIPASEYKKDTECSSLAPKPFNKPVIIESEAYKKILLRLYEEYLHQGPLYMELVMSEFKTLLIMIARDKASENTYPDYLEDILLYIDKIFLTKKTNDDIAKQFGFNKNYLSNIFKEHLGVSLHAYINNKKAFYAKQLLTATDMTIAEIAEETGFSSQNRFLEFFKNKFNMSPSEFRKTVRKYEKN